MKCPLIALLGRHAHIAHVLTILKMREPMASVPAECGQYLESCFKA